MVDERGNGIPFVVRDLSVCLKAVGNVGGWARALQHCLDNSVERGNRVLRDFERTANQ